MYKTYHIFSNNLDEWTQNLTEALLLFMEWRRDNGCARLYEEDRDTNDELINENCILSTGNYPQ